MINFMVLIIKIGIVFNFYPMANYPFVWHKKVGNFGPDKVISGAGYKTCFGIVIFSNRSLVQLCQKIFGTVAKRCSLRILFVGIIGLERTMVIKLATPEVIFTGQVVIESGYPVKKLIVFRIIPVSY